MAEIDKNLSPHTLQRSFATHLVEQNVDVRVIQVLLGHVKLDTMALYTRVTTISEVMSPREHIAGRFKSRLSRPANARLLCRARRWRSRISSAATDRHGAEPIPAV